MTTIQLDPQRLLGFRLEAREAVSLDGSGVSSAETRGVKTGLKRGDKPEVRIGIKAGGKPELSV